MKFVITESTWFRGHGPEQSRLLRQDGTMCCIGQICKQLGVPDSAILDSKTVVAIPSAEDEKTSEFIDAITLHGLNQAYCINDNANIDDVERKRQLVEHFERAGVGLDFVP